MLGNEALPQRLCDSGMYCIGHRFHESDLVRLERFRSCQRDRAIGYAISCDGKQGSVVDSKTAGEIRQSLGRRASRIHFAFDDRTFSFEGGIPEGIDPAKLFDNVGLDERRWQICIEAETLAEAEIIYVQATDRDEVVWNRQS